MRTNRDALELSSSQVMQLSKLVQEHKQLLHEAHADAARLLHSKLTPAYVVDYQLIHWYLFDRRNTPEKVLQLEYLFSCKEIRFILGPGSVRETIDAIVAIARLVDASFEARRDDPGSGSAGLVGLLRRLAQRRQDVFRLHPDYLVAFARLAALLEQENFTTFTEAAQELPDPEPDPRVVGSVLGRLDLERALKPGANEADAMNFASVVTLRKAAEAGRISYFPYLLTATRRLLNESQWSFDPVNEWGVQTHVSRNPTSAIYSQILLKLEKDPASAVRQSTEMDFRSSQLQRVLRRMPSYMGTRPKTVGTLGESGWGSTLLDAPIESRTGDVVRAAEAFVTDPVIEESLRITDNLEHTSGNWEAQQGRLLDEFSSSRRLFDLFRSLVRALDDSRSSGRYSVSRSWDGFIHKSTTRSHDWSVTTFRDASSTSRSSEYLRVEKHTTPHSFFSISWPCHVRADTVLRVFSAAFRRHPQETLAAVIGDRDGAVREFDVELPLTLEDLISVSSPDTPAAWIRLRGTEFDLHCDLATPAESDPLMAVIGRSPNVDHVVSLFETTSARFVFPTWVDGMLRSCELGSGPDAVN